MTQNLCGCKKFDFSFFPFTIRLLFDGKSQNSFPELDLFYEKGISFSGCLGARLTGAGFGGSGIALAKKEKEVEIGDGAKIHR